jgi:hypothetical protein
MLNLDAMVVIVKILYDKVVTEKISCPFPVTYYDLVNTQQAVTTVLTQAKPKKNPFSKLAIAAGANLLLKYYPGEINRICKMKSMKSENREFLKKIAIQITPNPELHHAKFTKICGAWIFSKAAIPMKTNLSIDDTDLITKAMGCEYFIAANEYKVFFESQWQKVFEAKTNAFPIPAFAISYFVKLIHCWGIANKQANLDTHKAYYKKLSDYYMLETQGPKILQFKIETPNDKLSDYVFKKFKAGEALSDIKTAKATLLKKQKEYIKLTQPKKYLREDDEY